MKWPWISRRAFDIVVEQRDNLAEQYEKLLDHITRMDRNEHGLTETPREPKKTLDAMPRVLVTYLQGFSSAPLRKQMETEMWAKRRTGVSWEQIQTHILKGEE